MLGRLFGKSKDTSGEAVCAECGRTLLAGEWTQTIEDDDGNELLLCSLCGQAHRPADDERLEVTSGAGAAHAAGQVAGEAGGRADSGRDENAALWKAIKDRDAQIESLRAELARGETERQELLGRLARLQAAAPSTAADRPSAPADETADDDVQAEPAPVPDEAEPSVTAEPDLFTLTDESEADGAADASPPAVDGADAAPPVAAEVTAEILAADPPAEETPDVHATSGVAESAPPVTRAGMEEEAEAPAEVNAEAEAQAALEAEAQASSMTLLQRGVDLLNVSPVPRKIAETNADLGIPTVHVGFDGETATVTFMWSMGWYRFAVDVESGAVSLGDRGYEERDDLQPNASVRADGTVQLAAARISRAAAQRAQSAPDATAAPAPVVDEPQPVEPAPVEPPESEVAPPASGPEILSKSLLGQRTDDERPSWEQTQARDFDWDH